MIVIKWGNRTSPYVLSRKLPRCSLFTGNDAIVAFSRRYDVVVVIHQLNEALWKIGEDDSQNVSSAVLNEEQGASEIMDGA